MGIDKNWYSLQTSQTLRTRGGTKVTEAVLGRVGVVVIEAVIKKVPASRIERLTSPLRVARSTTELSGRIQYTPESDLLFRVHLER